MRGLLAPALKLAVFAVVTILLTGLLAVTITGVSLGPERTYVAQFRDVLGLNEGDDVRMSGVRVGTVREIEAVDPRYAEVRFSIEDGRAVAADATAAVRYRNLIGQRYVAIDSAAPAPGEELPDGGTIPVERTTPALNLTELLGGFRPLFAALDPEQVNRLAEHVVAVLQGEGGTIDGVLAHTASLTATLAERDAVVGRVIDKLNAVLDTVNARDGELATLLDETQALVSGLAEQRRPIGDAVAAMGELADGTGDLLAHARAPLREGIANLGALSANLADAEPLVEHFLRTLPGKAATLTRVVSYGSWLNFYLCGVSGTVGVRALDVELPILPLPATSAAPRCGS
ncbi:phospholipid/cholesterol/gamma-HCH transport system substrate-binding protein [Amycolatopsis arida]|uniref:Phospholipid/cholesterol/gamma-HCH transport system substrate-binding protein n=1 Tax=Amycolatopsis arida TaxID=587909 RepID=A0A1I5VBT4_9PSEU|nr:MCE family protein [Amycolatopsis arida]TDX91221.1 phospholipid/cholesterol/gamma-HCH transport system substrate-binding protein [Amycolatopsis arida]SFQ04920.1 phospholipid/cholesterol/gamma-HCH transport system substrate-binding protein [Amycolatopsis arida]